MGLDYIVDREEIAPLFGNLAPQPVFIYGTARLDQKNLQELSTNSYRLKDQKLTCTESAAGCK
jgi:hypothetical protein